MQVLRNYTRLSPDGKKQVSLDLQNRLDRDSTPHFKYHCTEGPLSSSSGALGCSFTQDLDITAEQWRLYAHPTATKSIGRPQPVEFSNDLQSFRIGPVVFATTNVNTENKFQPLENIARDNPYIEEFAVRGNLVAICYRRTLVDNDLFAVDSQDVPSHSDEPDFAAFLHRKFKALNPDDEEEEEEPSGLSALNFLCKKKDVDDESGDTKGSEPEADSSDESDEDEDEKEASETSSLAIDESDDEPDANSACISWSEGSTYVPSEIDDAVHPEDFEESDEEIESDLDVSSDSESDKEIKVEDGISAEDDDEKDAIKVEADSILWEDPDQGIKADDDVDDVELKYRDEKSDSSDSWSSAESDNTDCDSSDEDNEERDLLENLLSGKNAQSVYGQAFLKIYDIAKPVDSPVFHFKHNMNGKIWSSPPAFHPTKPLIAWPLGGNEILFADVSSNTFFTRVMSCSLAKGCHVFIKVHFSANGKYVHFVALDTSLANFPKKSRRSNKQKKEEDEKQEVYLNLQITTHRLSQRKTTRAPPCLVYRSNVPLGKATRLDVSSDPFSLTWREKEVFFSSRTRKSPKSTTTADDEAKPSKSVNAFNVMRIPLFGKTIDGKITSTCYLRKPVELPSNATKGAVQYVPSALEAPTKPEQMAKWAAMGLQVIGEKARLKSVSLRSREEQDMDGWTTRPAEGEMKQLEAKIRKTAGSLQDNFETLHLVGDFDVEPHLS